MKNRETLQMVGLLVGLVVVILLNNWIFPNDLARTVVAVLAAP
jgi:hypothetical protein